MSTCLFNLYAEYILQDGRLNEAQAGLTIAGRNISNFRYTDDRYADAIPLMTESKEELKRLLMKVKEERGKKLA